VNLRVQKIFEGLAKSGRVANAYLFVGADLAAVEALADQLAVKKSDRFVFRPAGASFKIEQVRELQSLTRYGPSASKYLLATIDQADTLTDEAAAAFLKTLEEPSPGVVFILLVDREDKLPATIVSRCQKIIFPEESAAWQPLEEFGQYRLELKSLPGKNALAKLIFSTKLAKEKERLTELLYDLAHAARYESINVKMSRTILNTIRYLQRNVNVKTALDVMCLNV
jgi:DNA polymerase III delta prime subunit